VEFYQALLVSSHIHVFATTFLLPYHHKQIFVPEKLDLRRVLSNPRSFFSTVVDYGKEGVVTRSLLY
jgi:hypothetical protein